MGTFCISVCIFLSVYLFFFPLARLEEGKQTKQTKRATSSLHFFSFFFPEVISIYVTNSLNFSCFSKVKVPILFQVASAARDKMERGPQDSTHFALQLYIKTGRTPRRRRQLCARQVWDGRTLPALPDQLHHSRCSFLGHTYQSSPEEVQVTLPSKNYKSSPHLLQYNNWNNNKDVEQRRAFKIARWSCLL